LRLALLLKLRKTFGMSTNMPPTVCIATEAMAAYESFIQIMPPRHQDQHNLKHLVLWLHSYMAAHPEAWWEAEDAKIVDVVCALPLGHEAMEEVIELARFLKDPRRKNTFSSIREEEVHDDQRAKPPSNTNIWTQRKRTAHENSQDEEIKEHEDRPWFGEQVKEELEEVSTGSTGATEPPHKFRIGPRRYAYVFIKMSEGVYKCRRGSDTCPTGHKIFLLCIDGQWVAYDGPDNDSLPPIGHPIFTSYEDILVKGEHSWRIDDFESKLMTTVL
jgi:hypothetical protein